MQNEKPSMGGGGTYDIFWNCTIVFNAAFLSFQIGLTRYLKTCGGRVLEFLLERATSGLSRAIV